MKLSHLALLCAACVCAGCATEPLPTAPRVPPLSALPDCLAANYDSQRHLFTMKNAAPGEVNQQCLLTVWPRGTASASRITAGRYLVNLSDGGDGGAGGTLLDVNGGGGGGGGGAGARELQRIVDLSEGVYKLTLGAGGLGGNPCIPVPFFTFSGGPGYMGSPSSLSRVDTGEVLVGTPQADLYAWPSKAENEKRAGNPDGHGGSGPGKAKGGDGGRLDVSGLRPVGGDPGNSKAGTPGGTPGIVVADNRRIGAGGGGGASTQGEGGDGGGEVQRHWILPPERGALGSGGGGGEGTMFVCGAGASGGNGFMALQQR
jgi:hypothetical protein